MKKNLTLLMLLAYAMLLAGCNTVQGFGKDLSTLGNKIDKKAEQTK